MYYVTFNVTLYRRAFMKKFGFTLAEVLITLGIIGVVAALTAPALVMSSRNEANAAKLSVVMSNLENAFTNMLVTEGVDSLFQTRLWQNVNNRAAFAGNLGRYLHTNGYRDLAGQAGIRTYYGNNNLPCGMDRNGARDETKDLTANLGQAPAGGIGVNHLIETKNGATIFLTPNANQNPSQARIDEITSQGGSLYNLAADFYIDVNGVSAPNVLGRDIFAFYLGDDGILYPIGGLDVSVADGGGDNNLWNNAASPHRCLDGNIEWGYGCTARVISEGYKMNY